MDTFLPEHLELLVNNWLTWNQVGRVYWNSFFFKSRLTAGPWFFQSQQYAEELDELLELKNVDKIKDAFDGRLSFGTAGLRAAMGPGFKRMNDLVVVQSAQGLLHYMLGVFGGDSLTSSGIIVGYDGRYNSKRSSLKVEEINLILGV